MTGQADHRTGDSSSDLISEVVEHYSQFPFPLPDSDRPLLDVAQYISALAGFHDMDPSRWRILDAGCGSGNRLLGVAGSFPEAEVIGVEVADGAAALAKRRTSQCANATVLHGDLRDVPLPEDVDLVYSTGVLHHIEDPLPVVARLRAAMAPVSALVVWVYDSIGEFTRFLDRELVLALSHDLGVVSKLELARRVLPDLDEDRYGECYDFEPVSEVGHDSFLADAFTTPYVRGYRVSEVVELLAAAGLHHVELAGLTVPGRPTMRFEMDGFDNHPVFDIADHLSDENARERYRALPLTERWRVAELLARPTGLTVLAWSAQAYEGLAQRHRERVFVSEQDL